MNFPALVLRAHEFAQHAHQGQHRKDAARTPFIEHPVRVLGILRTVAQVEDPDVLSAALLHDVLEDTPVGLGLLRQCFGRRIADLVEEVTDDPSETLAERRTSRLMGMPLLSKEAALICFADKLANIEDMIDNPPLDWSVEDRIHYIRWVRLLHRNRPGLDRESPHLSRLIEQTTASAIVRISEPTFRHVDIAA
ncbi:MAG: HD domain-containing protein [Bdellovibrionota bacterium]